MVWFWRDPERDKQTTDEIDRQEDRGAAIIAASYLEDNLTAAIKTQLVQDDEVTEPLFKGRGQLSDFGTKIDFAYLLGLINKHQWRRLNTIRRIRNEFAHNLEPLMFKTPTIRDRCKNLYNSQDLAELRRVFDRAFSSADLSEHMASIDRWFTKVAIAQNQPRDTFMNAIQIMVILIQLKAMHGRMLFLPTSSQDISERQHPPGLQIGNRKSQKRERPPKSSLR